jgi:hypothetical protein
MLSYINRPETLLSLFPGAAMGTLTRAIFQAVDRSFKHAQGKMRQDIPLAEIRSRFSACVHWAKILRGDQKWGLERIIGQFDEILRCHLTKTDYKIPTRQCWVPEDGA